MRRQVRVLRQALVQAQVYRLLIQVHDHQRDLRLDHLRGHQVGLRRAHLQDHHRDRRPVLPQDHQLTPAPIHLRAHLHDQGIIQTTLFRTTRMFSEALAAYKKESP